jgi:hypothetical protein
MFYLQHNVITDNVINVIGLTNNSRNGGVYLLNLSRSQGNASGQWVSHPCS